MPSQQEDSYSLGAWRSTRVLGGPQSHSGLFLGQILRVQGIFPSVASLYQLHGVISLRAEQAFPSQELSQLFSPSHILQTDENFLQCLYFLKFFTKSFYICSACAQIFVACIKNPEFQLLRSCILHTAFS